MNKAIKEQALRENLSRRNQIQRNGRSSAGLFQAENVFK